MGLGQFLGIVLDDSPVVGHQAVDLAFHVGRLSVDGGRQSSADQRAQIPDELIIVLLQFLSGLVGAVAPIAFVPPQVPLHRQAEPTKLAQHGGTLRLGFGHGGAGIAVQVVHVAGTAVSPTTGAVDEASRVVLFGPRQHLVCLELAPTFVEGHPGDNAGMIVQPVDQCLEFVPVVLGRFRTPLQIGLITSDVPVAIGHILPNQKSQLVAPIVPAWRFDLDVFAAHVEAKLFGHLDVIT